MVSSLMSDVQEELGEDTDAYRDFLGVLTSLGDRRVVDTRIDVVRESTLATIRHLFVRSSFPKHPPRGPTMETPTPTLQRGTQR